MASLIQTPMDKIPSYSSNSSDSINNVSSYFSRRVSFNNLHPDDSIEEDIEYPNNYTTGNRKRKLAEAPSKSILKNKLSPQQLYYNLQHSKSLGINYHDDLNEMALPDESIPRSEYEPRRKSYSEMTDEELMALDPQFSTTKSKVSNVSQFKFDSQKTYYAPSRKSNNYLVNNAANAANALTKQSMYPLSNENNYKSISLTVKHEEFNQTNRTILSVISGRRHTWNSLDWLLLNNSKDESQWILNNGDHLVITSLIPLKFIKDIEMNNNKYKNYSNRQINIDELLYKKCESLLNYIMTNLPVALILKVTVEFVLDIPKDNWQLNIKNGYKYMLNHIYKQYQPTLIIIGNKSTNLNFKYPIRLSKDESSNDYNQFLVKLSSYIIKYSTIPTIIVGNSSKFHSSNHQISKNPKISIMEPNQSPPSSDLSPLSSNSNTYHPASSWDQICHSDDHKLKIASLQNDDNSEFKFANLISEISSASLSDCSTYLSNIPDKSDPITAEDDQNLFIFTNSKIHDIYKNQVYFSNNLNSQRRKSDTNNQKRRNSSYDINGNMYKVKSMISYDEEDERKNEKLIHSKKIKKTNSSSSSSSSETNNKKNGKKKRKSLLALFGLKK